INLLSRTPEQAHSELMVTLQPKLGTDAWPYDMSFFFVRPLLRFGDRVIAPSGRLLYAKLGFGLHHTLYYAIPRALRPRFSRIVGRAFQDYVSDLFARLAAREGTAAVRDRDMESMFEGHSLPKLCDGALQCGNTLILWEAKAWTTSD